MKWLLLLLLLTVSASAKDFLLEWDPSPTAGVMYRLWRSQGSGPFSIFALTSTTSAPVSLAPDAYSFYVTAITATNESDPSNTYMFPPPATVITGVRASTNAPPPFPDTIYVEMEAGTITSPMALVTYPGASGTAVQSGVANSGTVSIAVQLSGGTYVVWCRLIAVNSAADSVFVAVDGAEDIFGNEATLSPLFLWRKVTGGNGGPVRMFSLSAGQHIITFRGREAQVPLDAIYVTKDLNFTP